MTRLASQLLALMGLVLAACGDRKGSGDANAAAAGQIAAASGNGQTGVVGSRLPGALVVKVSNAAGDAVGGATVTWTVASGDGALSAPSTTTDAAGLSRTEWTLGTRAGPQTATATVTGLSPVIFTATAAPGPPTRLDTVAGGQQSGTTGTALRDSLVVRATDAYGNPAAGVLVRWTVAAGGGTIVPDSATTDPAGLAKAQWTLGTAAGQDTAFATVTGLPRVVFTAMVTAGVATKLEKVSPDPQAGPSGAALPGPLVVRVTDAAGNPVPGVNIGWQTNTGGGSIAPAIATTDSLGLARATWTLGAGAGTNTASAYAVGSSVTFSATARP